MHKGLGQIQRRMAGVDCVLEVGNARKQEGSDQRLVKKY